jgi:putrescine transport system substrate-binding protein
VDLIVGSAPVSRRSLLGALGLAGAALAIGACGNRGRPASSPDAIGPATPVGDVEGSLAMYSWSDDVNPDTIDLFKRRFGISSFRCDEYESNEALVAALGTGRTGHDVAAPTITWIPRLVEAGLIQRLDRSRIPNATAVDAPFLGLGWDPTDAYHVPKDYGTTGILYRSRFVPEPPTSWREFRALLTSDQFSGRSVFVDSPDDVLAFPLKLLGVSAGSVAKRDLDAARAILLEVAPHVQALDSTGYGERLRTGTAVLALGWAGPLATLRPDPEASDTTFVVPVEGTSAWLDTWVLLADAPHPKAGHAWLNFVLEPEVQAAETSYTRHAAPSSAAKALIDPALLADPAVFPPADVLPRIEVVGDTSGSTQRRDIWEEFRARVARG